MGIVDSGEVDGKRIPRKLNHIAAISRDDIDQWREKRCQALGQQLRAVA